MVKAETKVIPMIYDEVFKSVLQDKESEGYLVDIINNVTGIKKDYMKGNIVFKNVELPKNSVREKGKATDLIVEIKENIINLEMNKNYYEGLYDKNDSYIEKIKDGGCGYLLHPCVEINVRRTMGHVANSFGTDITDPTQLMHIIHDVNYKLKFDYIENNFVKVL